MTADRLHKILTAMSREGAGWSSARLCGACPDIVGVSGAGVMLMSGDIPRGSLCTTDRVSHLIEDLQYTLGEGPCMDAYLRDEVVIEPDLHVPVISRWPAFSPPAPTSVPASAAAMSRATFAASALWLSSWPACRPSSISHCRAHSFA